MQTTFSARFFFSKKKALHMDSLANKIPETNDATGKLSSPLRTFGVSRFDDEPASRIQKDEAHL